MTDWHRLLESGLSDIGAEAVARYPQLLRYLTLLDQWNRKINLTGLDPEARVRRLVLEPLWVATQLGPTGRYLDIGSGNGSPGIPWAILRGFSSSDLVESRGRRAVFLEVAARKIGLDPVTVHTARFEDVSGGLRAPDWVSLQGVRLDTELLRKIRGLNEDARVVWFTGNPVLPEPPSSRLELPHSDREAFVFAAPKRTAPGPA